ncbi:MAG TPA: DUF4013 domain-containing protein [Anaerolineaceae bacterium]|jgi:hypothetical protein|nr:DUF4013 domain-containing protein [Anaerolineaceae bacterium]
MNFGKAFSYVFDDQRWLEKIIIPILYSLIPVVGWMVMMGYVMRTIRNVAEGVEFPLPVCDFGDDLALGFKMFVVNLAYAVIPLLLMLLLMPLTYAVESSNSMPVLAILGLIILSLFLFVYGIVYSLIFPIIQANVAIKNSISAGFEFKQIFGMLTKNIGAWLLVYAGLLIGGLIAPLGSIAFFIGVFLTSMYSQLMTAHLAGQAYALTK